MNLVGKIFIVLILVMSLVFMGLVVAVYTTHTNWRTKSTELGEQLTTTRNEVTALKTETSNLTATLDTERKQKAEALAKLETDNDKLQQQVAEQEKERARLEQERRESVAAMDATQKTLDALRGEVERLRQEIATARQDRQEYFTKLVNATDQMHQMVNEMNALKSRSVTLADSHRRMVEGMRKLGLDPDRDYASAPPKVEGLVTAVRDGELVELSIGEDDGLREGHTLEVYRTANGSSTYLGRVQVTKSEADKAVARVLPGFQKGAIQRGDNVATQLY